MRNSTYFAIVLISFTLITVFYVGTSSDRFYIHLKELKISRDSKDSNLSSVRICCLILTTPKNFLDRAKAVNDTWGPRCDRHLFISEFVDQNLTGEQYQIAQQLPIAPIKNIVSGYAHLTQKTTSAFLFAYENYANDFDWFVKADDDTYLIVENLKRFLLRQDPSEPITFGYNFKVMVPKGYHSGGASYILSREALKRFHHAHTSSKSPCRKDKGAEDVEIARCLRTQGVYPGKSLDENNRELFHPLPFTDHFLGIFPDWMFDYAENPPQQSYNCCSDHSISFHYVSPNEQYLMDFLLYRIRSSNFVRNRWFIRSNGSYESVTN